MEHMEKYSLYLSISDKKITCEPSLALKQYYKWSLKHTYEIEVEEEKLFEFFENIIQKDDYKSLVKMEYEEFKGKAVAYYALGELYLNQNNIDLSRDYFNKVIEILEETLKSGNRYGHAIMKEKQDVSFFELMMWAKKNLGDMLSGEEALDKYEAIVSESDLLYLQKNHCIYKTAKAINLTNKAFEAARNIIKVLPNYENVNKEVVEFLIGSKEYLNGLDIAINEYRRLEDPYWINIVQRCCVNHENFNIQCVEKVICFADILLWNLKLTAWSEVILSLYKAIGNWNTAVVNLLEYLRLCFKKINYNNIDFSYFPQCINIINKIYNHININKYEIKELRKYEGDFEFFLLSASAHNKKFSYTIESSTKILANASLNKENSIVEELAEKHKALAIDEIFLEVEELKEIPWKYLDIKIKYAMEQCDYKTTEFSMDKEDNNKEYDDNFNNHGKIKEKFNFFNKKSNEYMDSIKNKISLEEKHMSEELEKLLDGIYRYKEIEHQISTNLTEFHSKIREDLKFLKEYGDEKIKLAIPESLEENLGIIDELTDLNTIKNLSEEKFKEVVIKWCEDNLYGLLAEQFNVFCSKYKNIYLEQMEIINKIEENRLNLNKICDKFMDEINPLVFVTPQDVVNSFTNHYNEFLNNMSYEVKLLPEENIINAITYNVKSVFVKSNEKVENLKNKIKAQVINNKINISIALKEKVFENIEDLSCKLEKEIEVLFSNLLSEVINDKNVAETKYDVMRLSYNELQVRNEEIQCLLNYINVEIEKFKSQFELGILYNNEKCYKV